jgi:ABC-type branched-subunit amino acid transport system substrate-binding protein
MARVRSLSKKRCTTRAIVVAALVVVAGCSSGSGGSSPAGTTGTSGAGGTSGSGGTGGTGGSGKTITVGLLTDVTGLAASSSKSSIEGVKAGQIYAARQGYTIKYILADTGTNPQTALAAAQRLVAQDHVNIVISHSAILYTTTNYLTAHNVVVIGPGEDGPEWATAKNMFSVYGVVHPTKVTDGLGRFLKAQGVTTFGSIGYSISPTSSEAAKSSAASAKSQGIKIGYLNAAFPFGGTNVQPEVIAMKAAGVNGFTATTDPNTAFALVTGMRQAGADVKVAIFSTGYGGDLDQAGPGALSAAQNVYFSLEYEPAELNTPATKQFVSDLKSAGVTSKPTYAEYNGYVSVGLLVQGLKATGGDTKSPALISALSGIHDWNALGLFGAHTINLSDRVDGVGGADNCIWITKLEGDNFTVVPGANPICGKELKGVTVSSS